MSFIIQKSKTKDIDSLMAIYEAAIRYMRRCGNNNQWTGGYPGKEVILHDIERGFSYTVYDENGRISGVFSMIDGIDPTYNKIEGEWADDNLPYLTIHRIASNGSSRGIGKAAFDYAKSHAASVRVDTHEDNVKMQELLLNNGFKYCGIIYLANGDPRRAYQYVK